MKRRVLGCAAGCVVMVLAVVMGGKGELLADEVAGGAVQQLGTVVVTASRHQESLTNVPANVTIVTQKDIQNSTAQDVPDLLRTIAGVHVSDITGNRRTYTVDLRGFGETAALNTLVLVDGRRTNEADLSGVDWSQIPLDRVARIEIIRGGRASVLYGDNAAAGVINILTKEGKGFSADVEAAGGSYDTFQTHARVRGKEGGLSYALSGSYLNSDGYRDNSETEAKDAGANLGYKWGESAGLTVGFGYHKDNSNLPGALKESDFAAGVDRTDTLHPDDFADTEDTYVTASPEIHFLTASRVKIDTGYRKRDVSSYASGDWGNFTAGYDIKTLSLSPQVLLGEPLFGLDNKLTLGVDYTDAKEAITNQSVFYGSSSTDKVDMEKENTGVYLHDELMVLPALGCSAGYRYDRATYDFESSANPGSDSNTTFDESLFTAGINYRFAAHSNAYMSFSRSWRYPVLEELFSFLTNTVNQGIGPQRSDDIEIGLRHTFVGGLRGRLNLFRMVTRNEIIYNPYTYANENLDGDTKRYGAEISVDQRFGWGSLALAYTYTRARIDGGQFDGSDFPNVPRHQASFKALIDILKPFTLALNATYMGNRPFISDFGNKLEDQDDYIIVNAKLKYEWKKLTVYLNLNNLLNKRYSEYGVVASNGEPSFYPSPKMNVMLGLSYAL
jgi:iron complex outermembrane recepter protein